MMVGRFQPFHNGHLSVVKQLAGSSNALIIGIGSAQYSHTEKNPFTAGERHLMISKTLEAEGIENYFIVPITDVNVYPIWVAHVESLVPPFDVVFSNNPLTELLFKQKGYKVENMPLYDRSQYSGKCVRETMLFSEDSKAWEKLVPAQVVDVINEVKGVERMRTIMENDEYHE